MLPNNFYPKYNYNLIRIGSANDGGYLAEKSSHDSAQTLISLGLNDNWTFEKEFSGNFKLPVIGFDCVLNAKFLIKKIVSCIILLYKFYDGKRYISLFKSISVYFDYLNHRKFFHQKFVGYSNNERSITFETLMQTYGTTTPMFLKCDIEGWEYRILDGLVQFERCFSGVVIEFHDVDLHRERIQSFIEKFSLTLVHIHPNNFAGVDNFGHPLVIEMTFAKNPVPLNFLPYSLPHPLDRPCSDAIAEIPLQIPDRAN